MNIEDETVERLTQLTLYMLFFCVAAPIVALVIRLCVWLVGY